MTTKAEASPGGPDWRKFGLDGEKQPLNPATGGGPSGGSSLLGGQVQSSNELFADDQGSKAAPWWMSHFLVSERVLFGTWDGVFTSCLINIFGVIVFLRSGWIVAEAGIGHAALIVLAAVALILIAVLACIGICERCHVQSGGVYFLIAHVLGSRRGAAVGMIYVIGQAIGNALCATGFGEAIAGIVSETHSPVTERLIAALVIVVLTFINLAGVKWVIRLQFALLVVLLLGAGDFAIGSFSHQNPEAGFMGWNASAWTANSKPNYTEHHNWFSVFGVFFPALTGVMAGINMSGDLRNPSQDIAVGTLAAVGTGSFLYLMFMLVLAGTCDRTALLTDFMIAEKVSALGFLLLSALYVSSVSSCLATLYGTPRVLQSIAAENVLPAFAFLADGKGPNKVPVNALVMISAITLFFIGIGDVNRLATLATMPFLITYGTIEYAYFVLSMQFDVNQQRLQKYHANGIASPTFDATKKPLTNGSGRKGSAGGSSVGSTDTASSVDSHGEAKGRNEEFAELLEKYSVDEIDEKPRNFYSPFCNRWISLTGFVIKMVLMFLIHWGYSCLCILLCVGIWFYIGQGAPGVNSGVAAEFSILDFVKRFMGRVTGGKVNLGKPDQQLVINPIQPTVETRSSHLNEVNTDFADRSQFHQTHTVQGSHFND
eukprot:maker-scaffold764_size101305-snap-gene-0.22 protein:Tk04088 transcript:maker-scaffold764_size101305-snap-gene-0.22-mRNA-1 annotation:"solute carrier family 12 member 8"